MLTLRQSLGQVRDKVTDTNHESPQHKSHHRLSWLVSTTFPTGKFRWSWRNGIWALHSKTTRPKL